MAEQEYITDAKEIMESLFREDWMDNNEYQEFIDEAMLAANITWEKLSDDIKKGVENGYSVEQQKDALKQLLSK